MTTHAQKADAYLEMALSEKFEKSPAGSTAATLAVSMAQAHATLELAEQQRIANLIALGVLGEHSILTEQVSEDAAISLVEHKEHAMGGYFQLKPEIVAALGIEQDS